MGIKWNIQCIYFINLLLCLFLPFPILSPYCIKKVLSENYSGIYYKYICIVEIGIQIKHTMGIFWYISICLLSFLLSYIYGTDWKSSDIYNGNILYISIFFLALLHVYNKSYLQIESWVNIIIEIVLEISRCFFSDSLSSIKIQIK